MNLLDMRTVLLGHIGTSILCLTVVAILWYRYRRRFEGLAFWLADYALQLASVLLAFARVFAPEWVANMTSPPALAVGMILFFVGLERFTGKRGPQPRNWVLLGIYLLAQGYFSLVAPSLTARNILLSAFQAVLCARCAWLLLRRVDPAMRPLTRGLGYVLVAIALTSVTRIAVDASFPVGNDFLHSPDRDTVFLFLFQFLGVALVFALSLMVSRILLESDRARGDEAEKLAQEIRELNAELERKVEERTGQLDSARAALEEQLRETREAHRAKGESEERFRGVFDNAPVGIFAIAGDGRILLANRALADMLGADSPTQFGGLNLCRDLCRVGEGPGLCLPHWVSEAMPYLHEVEWRRLDGAPLWVRVRVKPARQPRGEIRYEGTVEDITAVRRTQERLRILETAIGNMDLGLLISDPGGRILFANPSAGHIHGYEVEEIIGRESRMLGPESQRHERTQGSPVPALVYRREGLNRRADGTLFPVFLTSLPVCDPQGSPFCFITTCQDLTEAKRRDLQLQEALRDAQVGKLAAVVAHQVNTPLAAMKTRLEMLREDAGEDEGARKSLDGLMKQVDKVAQTVRALLGYVRQRNLGEEFTSIQGVVASVARLFESAFQSKGILLESHQPEESLRVQGNAADLQEVFLNLFENYREMLGKDNRVAISIRPSGASVEVRLEDDGPGLGADPERVFEPFYTTKAHGTGLGLPICRNILTACGGTIVSENRPPEEGGGARFVVTLPIAPREAPPKEAP